MRLVTRSTTARVGERESRPPGTCSWIELSTNDVSGARKFYVSLFGWALQDNPIMRPATPEERPS